MIINEVITVIGDEIDLKTAISTFNLLYDIFSIIDEYEDNDFNFDNMMIYEKYQGRLSLTDCSIILDMHNNDIENLIALIMNSKRLMA